MSEFTLKSPILTKLFSFKLRMNEGYNTVDFKGNSRDTNMRQKYRKMY